MNAFPRTIACYPLPNAIGTEEDSERLRNQDLPSMSAKGLFLERLRVERALAGIGLRAYMTTTRPPYFMDATDWLIARVRAIRDELAKRGGRSGR